MSRVYDIMFPFSGFCGFYARVECFIVLFFLPSIPLIRRGRGNGNEDFLLVGSMILLQTGSGNPALPYRNAPARHPTPSSAVV